MPRASSRVAGARTRSPGMWAYHPSRLWECWAASCRPAPVVIRITSGTLNCPPDMCSSEAALLRIWSSATRLTLTVMISTIGRLPPLAAPLPAPPEVLDLDGRLETHRLPPERQVGGVVTTVGRRSSVSDRAPSGV